MDHEFTDIEVKADALALPEGELRRNATACIYSTTTTNCSDTFGG